MFFKLEVIFRPIFTLHPFSPGEQGCNFSFTDDIMDGYTIGFLITIAVGGFVIFKFLRLLKDSGAEWRNTSMDERDVFHDMTYDPSYSNLPGNVFHNNSEDFK